jgi:hypothetical protein
MPDVWYLTNSYTAFRELINLRGFEVCDGFEMPSRDTRINSTQTMQNILACVGFQSLDEGRRLCDRLYEDKLEIASTPFDTISERDRM